MTKRITVIIEDMECPNCAMRLESIEDRLEGVSMAEASYQKGNMVVEYDEKQINEAQIQAEIQRLGYQVSKIQPASR